MSILPSRVQDLIEFMNLHAPIWVTNAAGIGVLPSAASSFSALAAAAQNAYTARLNADEAARVALVAQKTAVADARRAASDLIRTIKAFAENAPKPTVVYNLAQIPPPATPGSVPPPGTPSNFNVTLLQSGALELKWKCINPPGASGTVYEIQRRIGEGAWTTLPPSGARTFIDSTIPSGGSPVMYQITGIRSTLRGQPATFSVMFGVGGNGAARVSVVADASAAKAAA